MNKLLMAALFSGSAYAVDGPVDCPEYREAFAAGVKYSIKIEPKRGIKPLVPVRITPAGLEWLLSRKARVSESCWIATNREFSRAVQ